MVDNSVEVIVRQMSGYEQMSMSINGEIEMS